MGHYATEYRASFTDINTTMNMVIYNNTNVGLPQFLAEGYNAPVHMCVDKYERVSKQKVYQTANQGHGTKTCRPW